MLSWNTFIFFCVCVCCRKDLGLQWQAEELLLVQKYETFQGTTTCDSVVNARIYIVFPNKWKGDIEKFARGKLLKVTLKLKKILCFHKEKTHLSVFISRVLLAQILRLWCLWGKHCLGDASLVCPSLRAPIQSPVITTKGLVKSLVSCFPLQAKQPALPPDLQIACGPVLNM